MESKILVNISISFLALVKTAKLCISPYSLVGQQCLFFSRPYEPWGITQSWDQVGTLPSTQILLFFPFYRLIRTSMMPPSSAWREEGS